MSIDSLDSLLEKLNSGDAAAAEQAFLTYEPYLRKVVRRLLPAELRAKFDSIDVVQSIYCDVFSAFREGGMRFGNVLQLRAFLIKATRNRFIDRVRQYQNAARRELPMSDNRNAQLQLTREPRPSESAEAQELWQRLLELCPREHHQLLWLRRRGASAGEIATVTGLHEGSVRRILRELSLRLACSATAETGS
jgi:RNA polymerase sigma-70 factor (ECF subfamily)